MAMGEGTAAVRSGKKSSSIAARKGKSPAAARRNTAASLVSNAAFTAQHGDGTADGVGYRGSVLSRRHMLTGADSAPAPAPTLSKRPAAAAAAAEARSSDTGVYIPPLKSLRSTSTERGGHAAARGGGGSGGTGTRLRHTRAPLSTVTAKPVKRSTSADRGRGGGGGGGGGGDASERLTHTASFARPVPLNSTAGGASSSSAAASAHPGRNTTLRHRSPDPLKRRTKSPGVQARSDVSRLHAAPRREQQDPTSRTHVVPRKRTTKLAASASAPALVNSKSSRAAAAAASTAAAAAAPAAAAATADSPHSSRATSVSAVDRHVTPPKTRGGPRSVSAKHAQPAFTTGGAGAASRHADTSVHSRPHATSPVLRRHGTGGGASGTAVERSHTAGSVTAGGERGGGIGRDREGRKSVSGKVANYRATSADRKRRTASPGVTLRARSGNHARPSAAAAAAAASGRGASTLSHEVPAQFARSPAAAGATASFTYACSTIGQGLSGAGEFAGGDDAFSEPGSGKLNYGDGGYLQSFPGDTLDGRYRLLSRLGRGQSSTVWLARDMQKEPGDEHEYVAVKLTRCSANVRCSSCHEVALLYYIAHYTAKTGRDAVFGGGKAAAAAAAADDSSPNEVVVDGEKRAAAEAAAAAAAQESGSAVLLNHFEHEGRHGVHVCMVFELLGKPLDALMAHCQFRGLNDLPLIKNITRSILHGLRELKRINVVHTDLKPENLMFVPPAAGGKPEGSSGAAKRVKPTRVKVSDFGLSFLLQDRNGLKPDGVPLDEDDYRVIRASNYVKGALIQTREYRAPEIILGNDFDCETDIWSLACIVYEMATGRFLFDPKSKPGVCDERTNDLQHLSEITQLIGPPSLSTLASGVYARKLYEPGCTHPRSFTSAVARMPDVRLALQRCLGHEEAAVAHDFLLKCLTWSPSERPSAEECLRHPWLANTRHSGRSTQYARPAPAPSLANFSDSVVPPPTL
eukprot:Rhum_TRINITY_DN11048_c0_g1::Rhum_TRINITY_DN11048_c0_g1_i1::g.42139::m.42139